MIFSRLFRLDKNRSGKERAIVVEGTEGLQNAAYVGGLPAHRNKPEHRRGLEARQTYLAHPLVVVLVLVKHRVDRNGPLGFLGNFVQLPEIHAPFASVHADLLQCDRSSTVEDRVDQNNVGYQINDNGSSSSSTRSGSRAAGTAGTSATPASPQPPSNLIPYQTVTMLIPTLLISLKFSHLVVDVFAVILNMLRKIIESGRHLNKPVPLHMSFQPW